MPEIPFSELAQDRSVFEAAGIRSPAPSAEISFAEIAPATGGDIISPDDIADVDTFYRRPKNELFEDDAFDPRAYFTQNPDIAKDPAQLQKLIDVYRARRERGITAGALKEAVKSAPATGVKFAKGAYKLASNVFEFSGLQPLFNKAASVVTGDAFDAQRSAALDEESGKSATKALAEFQAGTELSATGISDLGRTGARKIFGKAVKDLSDQELLAQLSEDASFQTQLGEVQHGRGESLKAAGLDADTLAKEGIELDPEAIENLSLVDPATIIATGGLFKVVGTGGKVLATAGTRAAAVKAAAALNNAVKVTAGKTVQGTGKVITGGAKAAGAVVGAIPEVAAEATGAAIGLSKGGLGGAYVGAKAAQGAQRGFVKGAGTVARAGEAVSDFGRQIAGEIPRSAGLEKIFGVVGSSPVRGAVAGAAVGTLGAAPLALLTDDDVAAGGILGGGLILGTTAGAVLGTKTAIGEFAAKRQFDPHGQSLPVIDSPAYGIDPALDAAHEIQLRKLSPNEQGAVTTFREAVRGLGGEIYATDAAGFKAALTDIATQQNGGSPLSPAQLAAVDTGAKTLGVFDASLPSPSGGNRRVVFLNSDAAALPHDAGHLFEALLSPDKSAELRDAARQFYTPEQISQFKSNYEARLGSKVSENYIIGEMVAENFSALFNNVPVTELTAPKGFLSKLGTVLTEGAEALGMDLTGGRVTPDLQAPVSHRLRGLFENAARQVAEANKAAPAAPAAPPASTPTAPASTPTAPASTPTAPRNIRVTPGQQDAFAKRAADTGITEAKTLAASDPAVAARVNEVSALMEGGNPVLEIEHLGIKSGGSATAPEGRSSRRATQETGYAELERLRVENRANAPESVVNAHQKTFVPVRWTNQGGTPTLVAMSLDKVISNTHRIVREAANKNASALIPYPSEQGRLSEAGWQQVVSDAQAYAENQHNGFRGDGQRLTRPTEDAGLSVPAENPDYRPQLLDSSKADFHNLIQGLATPETAREVKGSVPGNIKGQILAEANKRTTLTPADIKPKNVGKQEFASFPGRSLKEVNPLRNELVKRGVPVRELIEVTERIRAKDIASVKPRPDINFKAPVTDLIRGGFLPSELPFGEATSRVVSSSPDEFNAMSHSWKGGLTGEAWRIGRGVKSEAEVAVLKQLQEQEAAKGREAMKSGDFDNAMTPVMKGQFFREAWEAATGEGSAGLGIPREDPSYVPPFPTENTKGKFPAAPSEGPKFLPAPSKEIQGLAEQYAKSAGIPYTPARTYAPINPELGRRLADFYESAKHSPADPAVQASYRALADETLAQLKSLQDAGYTLELYPGEGEPYKNSADAIADARDNKHLYVLKTDENFSGAADNPLLAPSGVEGLPTVNDVFRGVHDLFGHAKEGYQFGPRGEFNAWRAHSEMYSPAAQGALAAETLAQNSWVNFGKHLEGRDIPASERPFAKQKAVVVPPELIDEARGVAAGDKRLVGGAHFAKFFDKTERTPGGGATIKNFRDTLELPTEGLEPQLAAYLKFGSNFQKHIAASIPGFVDARIRLMAGLEDFAKTRPEGEPVTMLDITSSEGYFPKAWAESVQQGGRDARATTVDALPAFEESFYRTPQVPNVNFELAAWGEAFNDPTTGRDIPLFEPEGNYDIVHEGMGFQFFTPDRENALTEVKRILKPDGVFITLEKFKNPDYAAREKLKDESKARFFSKEQMSAKAKEVLTPQNPDGVGMSDFQFDRAAYENILASKWKHVEQVWSSGNFAGYVASDSPTAVRTVVDRMGSTNTRFSHEATPRKISGEGAGVQFLPRTDKGRALEETGFVIKPHGQLGVRGVEIFDSERDLIGEIQSVQRGKGLAEVSFVRVRQEEQGQGVGEVLYRELADQLKADGIKTVTGAVVSPGPLAIRRKVFGGFKEIKLNGEPATFEQAIQTAARVVDTASAPRKEVAAIEPVNEITPESQFLPAEDFPEGVDPILQAAVKSPDGKIYTGRHHAEATEKYTSEVYAQNRRPDEHPDGEPVVEDGFVTRSGKFLDRDEAFAHARSIEQLREDSDAAKWASKGGLESYDFHADRSFLPRTKAGKALLEEGIDFEILPREDDPGFSKSRYAAAGQIAVRDTRRKGVDPRVGFLDFSYDELGGTAHVDNIYVDEGYRRRELGSTLYKELATYLRTLGIQELTGEIETPAAVKTRTAVFPRTSFEDNDGFSISRRKAVLNTDDGDSVRATTQIPTTVKFLPRVKRNEEGQPLTKDGLVDYERLYKEKAAQKKRADKEDVDLSKYDLPSNQTEIPGVGKTGTTGWILPDKSFVPLATAYHEQYLSDNASALNKKFGTKFGAEPDVEERLAALNRGFVRVRYDANQGALHVEVNSDAWRKLKPAVVDHLLDNEGQIDNLNVSLLNNGGQVVDSIRERLVEVEGAEKVDKISEALDSLRASGPRFLPGAQYKPEEIKFAKGWVDPSGKFYTFKKYGLGTHDDFAREFLHNLTPERTLEQEVNDRNGRSASDELYRRGWVRFTPYGGDSAMVNNEGGPPLSPKQTRELVDWAAQSEGLRSLYFNNATDRLKVLWSEADREGGAFLPREQSFKGFEPPTPEELAARRAKQKTAKIKANNPEAILPQYGRDDDGNLSVRPDGKPRAVAIEYDLLNSPLGREAAKGLRGAAREEAVAAALGDKLAAAHKAAIKNPDLQAGSKWYSTARVRLKKLLGDDAKLFAELLGATSARTPVETNFRFALDAYNQFKAGEFDPNLAKYREGKSAWDSGDVADFIKATKNEDPTRGQFLDWWVTKFELSPRQTNGKLYGPNSRAVLRVLDGSWQSEVKGPKTPNFAGNLSGATFDATVDVWAARGLHRLANEGNPKRWRILPENETGVTDADFYLGQAAYRHAAEKIGIKPDALQAILWFAEKLKWEKEGWTRGAGAERSDFNALLKETERTESGALRRKTPQTELDLAVEPGDIKPKRK